MKQRLDKVMIDRQLTGSRSQATNYIKLGLVFVNGQPATKPGFLVNPIDMIDLRVPNQYVSRAGLKLDSVSKILGLNFNDQVVLDVGSSTGGFTDYALKHGARLVIAVDVGTDQLHPTLRDNPKIELHEKTDIRDFKLLHNQMPDMILIDVSFISLRKILPYLYFHMNNKCVQKSTLTVAMLKPQFEAKRHQLNKGIVKNSTIRREITRDFETWVKEYYQILKKQDSQISGEKGNIERFYLLAPKPFKH